MWNINRPLIERDLATARAQSDEAAWQRAWQEGQAMTMEQAITHAQDFTPEHMPRADEPSRTYPDDLSKREVEVLRLIAAGKSNQEIAHELVLSRRTAERHVSNIYQKIGASGKVARATATDYAHRHGLTK
jgi:DNA-binding NarL/FixJ family response regulator